MILSLHNKKIIVKRNKVPEHYSNVNITYEFELGTNHLYPYLYIKGKEYKGNNIYIPMDFTDDALELIVLLKDSMGNVVKQYISTLQYYKTCTLGTPLLIDVYKELERLQAEVIRLQEHGEVI